MTADLLSVRRRFMQHVEPLGKEKGAVDLDVYELT